MAELLGKSRVASEVPSFLFHSVKQWLCLDIADGVRLPIMLRRIPVIWKFWPSMPTTLRRRSG